jgi:hypothetical protein
MGKKKNDLQALSTRRLLAKIIHTVAIDIIICSYALMQDLSVYWRSQSKSMPSRPEACREAPKTSLQFWQLDSRIVAAAVNKRTSKEFGTCTKDQKSENGTVVHSLAFSEILEQ